MAGARTGAGRALQRARRPAASPRARWLRLPQPRRRRRRLRVAHADAERARGLRLTSRRTRRAWAGASSSAGACSAGPSRAAASSSCSRRAPRAARGSSSTSSAATARALSLELPLPFPGPADYQFRGGLGTRVRLPVRRGGVEPGGGVRALSALSASGSTEGADRAAPEPRVSVLIGAYNSAADARARDRLDAGPDGQRPRADRHRRRLARRLGRDRACRRRARSARAGGLAGPERGHRPACQPRPQHRARPVRRGPGRRRLLGAVASRAPARRARASPAVAVVGSRMAEVDERGRRLRRGRASPPAR